MTLQILLLLTITIVASRTWTNWFSRDTPLGSGDFEVLEQFGCGAFQVEAIQCREVGSEYSAIGNVVTEFYNCTTEGGYRCLNVDQENGTLCVDVEVRVQCRNYLLCTNGTCPCAAGYEWSDEYETCYPKNPANCSDGKVAVDKDHCCPEGKVLLWPDGNNFSCVDPDPCLTTCGDGYRSCNATFCGACPPNSALDEETNECVCDEGYKGEYCEEITCSCDGSEHGNCLNPGNCTCDRGYRGDQCNEFDCSCYDSVNGRCTDAEDCTCNTGYRGDQCDEFDCSCYDSANGRCTDAEDCTCNTGYRGDQCNEFDCSCYDSINGRCTGVAECTCISGFTGALCNVAVTIIDGDTTVHDNYQGDLNMTGSTVTIGNNVVVQGNLNVLRNSVISFTNTNPMIISGTVYFDKTSTIRTDFSLERKKDLIGAPQVLITGGDFEGEENIVNKPSECKDNIQETYYIEENNLIVLFENCGLEWILLLVVILAILATCTILLLLILFVPSIRNVVLPFRDRKTKNKS